MKKDRQEPLEQLNNETPAVQIPAVEESFTLEDIIKEFGGWTKNPEPSEPELPAPEPEEQPEERPEEPEEKTEKEPEEQPKESVSEVMRVAAADHAVKGKPVDLTGDTIRFKVVDEEALQAVQQPTQTSAAEMPEEPQPDKEQLRARKRAERRNRLRLKKQEFQRRKANRAAIRAARRDEPETLYPSAEDACAEYGKIGSLKIRMLVSAVLCVLSLATLALGSRAIGPVDLTGSSRQFGLFMMAAMMVQCVLSYEVFVRGIYQAIKLRFDLNSLLTLGVMVVAADGFMAIPEMRLPFCAVPQMLLVISLWGIYLDKKAKHRTLKTVLSMENPMGAAKVEKAWHGLDCIFRRSGSLSDFTAMLETPDAAQKTMRVYAPAAAVATVALAGYASVRGQGEFLWAWAALLAAALPAGGFIAASRPFSILAKQMHHDGAAICGWRGAKSLSGECGIMIEDADLFPKSNITMNGMKMYSELPARQVLGYATAVIKAAGSGLLPLFEEAMKNEDGRRYSADSFHQYEGGGLGAEIHGDVVLLGSLAFMRLMGVRVPEGTKVQSALYISVNKELVGVFALTYQPSAGTRSGLNQVMRSAGLTPVLATRDFMITPALVKKRYKISVDRVEFPIVSERIRLSSGKLGESGVCGALMGKDNFLSFASAVAGGRLLRRAVHSGVVLSVFCGILGMTLMGVMTYLGSVAALSAANLALFHLLWLIPTLLVTGLIGKS